MKKCSKCGVQKPLSEFTKKKTNKDGFDLWCKYCKSAAHKNWIQSNQPQKKKCVLRALQWNLKNKEKRQIIVKRNNYKKRYGLSIEQKQELIDKQDNKCAICNNNLKDTHDVCVDHCHTTNIVRGILCRKCNLGIGHLNDSTQILKSAIMYLNKYVKKDKN
jgi:Recombination endonuclease VII